MRLIENVHYTSLELPVGGAGVFSTSHIGVYVADVHDGIVTLFTKTDPDCDWDRIIKHGEQLRRERLASNAKRKRIARTGHKR